MRIPYRQRWVLRRMDRRLRRSDPHVAAMLAIFARLYAGETIASREQAGQPRTRVRCAIAWLAGAMAGAAAGLAAGARWAFRRVASACAVVRWRLSGGTPTAPDPSSAAGPPARRPGPEMPAG
jgi:hypothetical protein